MALADWPLGASDTPTWRPNPKVTSYDFDVLASDEDFSRGVCIAMIEDFAYAAYPTALNAKTGNWERGGPHQDRVAARQWAERVADLHPTKPNDERPAFYYDPGAKQ